jgi:hypothetical protein
VGAGTVSSAEVIQRLSPGQLAEIDRIWAAYPHLRDDEFIAKNLDRWIA